MMMIDLYFLPFLALEEGRQHKKEVCFFLIFVLFMYIHNLNT